MPKASNSARLSGATRYSLYGIPFSLSALIDQGGGNIGSAHKLHIALKGDTVN